jgi:hypothetical protein
MTTKHGRATAASPRSRQIHAGTQKARRMIVLTSWEQQERPRLMYALTEERGISTSYAAVPVAGGWLFIQL